MKHLTATLLAIAAWPRLAPAMSNNAFEVDIISPAAGGRYRINQYRGIGIVIAIQNPRVAEKNGWEFSWTVHSPELKPLPPAYPGAYKYDYSNFGSIQRDSEPSESEPKHDIYKDERIYIALTHFSNPYGFARLPLMPAGEYVFEWKVFSAPCWVPGGGIRIMSPAGEGSFNFTISDDDNAPWPDLRPSPCAYLAGQASFAVTATGVTESSYQSRPTPSTSSCAGALVTVTETAEPCRATIGSEQAKRISSIMSWVDGSPMATSTATATATSSPPPVAESKTSGATRVVSVLSSHSLLHIVGLLSLLLVFTGVFSYFQ